LRPSIKVLVVDDEKLIRWSLSQMLADVGHEVIEAEDGLTALDLVAEESPDVVLLDLRLPGLDGMAVLREIRDKFPGCAVVIISAYGTPEVRTEALELGAVEFVRKPFQAEEIEGLVGRLAEASH